jgi:hypothetical protein
MLTAAVLAAWPWARSRRRFAVAGVATLLSWIAWHLLLNATGAFGFDVDAPLIRVSWEDVGSGVVALFTTVVVFGLGTERRETAVRAVGAAAICTRAVARRPTKDHFTAQMPRSEVVMVGSTAPWACPCSPCLWLWRCSSSCRRVTTAILPRSGLFTRVRVR